MRRSPSRLLLEVPVMSFLAWSALQLEPRWFGVKSDEASPFAAPAAVGQVA